MMPNLACAKGYSYSVNKMIQESKAILNGQFNQSSCAVRFGPDLVFI